MYVYFWEKRGLSVLFLSVSLVLSGQSKLTLRLQDCIDRATESTLSAFIAKNMYLASYWDYRIYKAQKLPFAKIQLVPVQYYSNFVKRYDFNENIEVYRQQQLLLSTGGLSVSQNINLTGGTFILDTGLDFMRYFGDNIYNQYSSVPFRVGYSQSLFGFNSFKWKNKIEPLKFEKARQQFLYAREDIAESTVSYFFNLAAARAEYDMAAELLASTDSLYLAGRERRRISTISEADLLALHLDLLNAETGLEYAKIELEKAHLALCSFLNLGNEIEIELVLPELPNFFEVSAEEVFFHTRTNNPMLMKYRQTLLELEQEVDRNRKSYGVDASLSASLGFNKAADHFREAYSNPLRQDMVSISVSVPILDWGIKKGKVNVAKNNLDVARLSVEQTERDLEQEIRILVLEFNRHKDFIRKASEALNMGIQAFDINKQRFLIGKEEVNTVLLSINRRKEAQRNFIYALSNYWIGYYYLRKLTLYDFERKEKLFFLFDELVKE